MYIDNARTTLSRCDLRRAPPTRSGFDCSAPLPPLTAGAHTLELASFIVDPSGILESARSAPLRVFMAGTRTQRLDVRIDNLHYDGRRAQPQRRSSSPTVCRIRLISRSLRTAQFYIAERGGIVRVIRNGTLLRDPALDVSAEIAMPHGGLLAIALDPKFSESGLMYALYAAAAPRGGLEFMLARFRGVARQICRTCDSARSRVRISRRREWRTANRGGWKVVRRTGQRRRSTDSREFRLVQREGADG